MARKKWEPSGLYSGSGAKQQCQNGARWWRKQGYEVRIAKVKGGYKHYRRKK